MEVCQKFYGYAGSAQMKKVENTSGIFRSKEIMEWVGRENVHSLLGVRPTTVKNVDYLMKFFLSMLSAST